MMTRNSTTRGFKRTAALVQDRIRRASQTRGFAETRLLTRWVEIAGEETAAISRPVSVTFTRQGLGATLTLLTTGANAPVLEMQKEQLRQKVNAVYGYNAIARIRLTQTAPTGFAEGQAEFTRKPKAQAAPSPQVQAEASRLTAPVQDESLRQALENLGRNVLHRRK